MELTQKDTARVLAGLRLLEDLRSEPPMVTLTEPEQHFGLKDIMTNGGEFPPPTPEEIDALCERINSNKRLCPYCEEEMVFAGYSNNEYTDNDHTAKWACPNRACWASVSIVRHPPDPYHNTAEREVFLRRSDGDYRLSAFDNQESYILEKRRIEENELPPQEWIEATYFDGPAQMWCDFYERVGAAIFNGYDIVEVVDNR